MRATVWKGEESRPARVYRFCDCSTCQSQKEDGDVGYISGSTEGGMGFTVVLNDESVYHRVREVLGEGTSRVAGGWR